MREVQSFQHLQPGDTNDVAALFERVFTIAADAEEGRLIGALARQLACDIDARNTLGLAVKVEQEIIAAIFISRLDCDPSLDAMLLAPVAVETSFQRQGIGRQLIQHGIDQLRSAGTQLLITYGDPAFYSKAGFEPISDKIIQPPYTLSQPHGWQALSLQDRPLDSFACRCRCVSALNDSRFW